MVGRGCLQCRLVSPSCSFDVALLGLAGVPQSIQKASFSFSRGDSKEYASQAPADVVRPRRVCIRDMGELMAFMRSLSEHVQTKKGEVDWAATGMIHLKCTLFVDSEGCYDEKVPPNRLAHQVAVLTPAPAPPQEWVIKAQSVKMEASPVRSPPRSPKRGSDVLTHGWHAGQEREENNVCEGRAGPRQAYGAPRRAHRSPSSSSELRSRQRRFRPRPLRPSMAPALR